VLSSVALVVCLSAFAIFAYLIIKHASRLNNDSDIAKRWGSLFEELKNYRGWKISSFYVVFLIRRLVYVTPSLSSSALSALVFLYLVT
jgi:hypothetical protein